MKYKETFIVTISVVLILCFIGLAGEKKDKLEEAKRAEEDRLEKIESQRVEEDNKEIEEEDNTTISKDTYIEKDFELGREKKHELVWYDEGKNIYHTTYEKCDARSYCDLDTGEYRKKVLWEFEDELDENMKLCSFCHLVEVNRNKPEWLKDPGF